MTSFIQSHEIRAKTTHVSLWVLAAGLAAMPVLGHAQEGQAADQSSLTGGTREVEEIIVTGLKGDVSVQRAPVTVNIVEGEAIAEKGLTSVEQLTSAVPGVRINQAPGGLVNPVVRGLGSSPSNNSFEQTVGLFIDGVFAGHPRDYSAALFDIDRVELLKGTQSAVVGKNTSVGALTLVTRKPELGVYGAAASYYHEFELGTDTVTASGNVPIGENLAFRIAGIYSDEGGWMKTVLDNSDAEPAVRRRAVRGTLRFSPSADLDWNVSFQYFDQKQRGQYFRSGYDTNGYAAIGAALGGDPNYASRRYETRNTNRPGGFDFFGLSDIGSKTDGTRFNSTLVYNLGTTTLTSVTGYSEYTDTFIIDGASLINSPVMRAGRETDKSFSQELRIATDPGKPLSIIAGAYYYNDKWRYTDMFDVLAAQMVVPPLGGSFINTYRQKTETFSLFGQALYKFTDNFQAAASIRYEHFSKDGDYSDRVILRPGGLTAAVYGAYPAFSLSNSRDYVDYSGQLQYFFTPAVNVYAGYSTGTKGFGYVASPSAPGGVVTDPFFNTEQSETFEAGVKAKLAPGTNVNLAVFNTRLKDYQIGVNLGVQFLIRNDQIRSRGVEGNLNVRIAEGLNASLTATYANARKLGTLPANSIRGLPFAPKLSGLGTLSYDTPITSELRFKGNVSAEFRTSQHLNDVTTFVLPSVPGRIRTDLRLAVEHEPTNIEAALVVRNLFDVYALSYGFNQFGASGAIQVAEEMPRTIGIQVSFHY